MRIRHQLASYSPVPAASLTAAFQSVVSSSDARERLRSELASEYAADTVVLTASGTHALQLALLAAIDRLGKNAIVAIPAFCCFDMATAVVGADVAIALYDLEPSTLAPDFGSLERALQDGARVIVIAPLYGVPVDWSEVQSLASRYDAVVIEDAAQGHGASWEGRPLGSLDRLSVLSFGRGKGWSGGGGGALLLRDVDADAVSRTLPPGRVDESRTFAKLTAQWTLGRPAIYGIPRALPLGLGETHYRAPDPPADMTRAAAAALLASKAASIAEAEHRRRVATEILEDMVGASNASVISIPAGGIAGYIRFPVRLSRGMENFSNASDAIAGGIAPTYPVTLAELPQMRTRIAGRSVANPGASALVRELVTLPVHSGVTAPELARNTAMISKAARM